MFWTLSPTDSPYDLLTEPITYCEHHALEQTNRATDAAGVENFGSMAEAAAILTALAAIGGTDLGMSSSEEGICELCEHIATCPNCGPAAQVESA